jgi:DNA repair ATPase RecN
MPGFADLMKSIETKRQATATFRPVALHVHSPSSYDYGRHLDGKRSASKDDATFVAAINSSGLAIVAITDHMKCDFACRLSASIGKNSPCILPGIEINVRPDPPLNTFRLHVLAIFPQCQSVDQINRIMPATVPAEQNRTGQEEIPSMSLAALVNLVQKHGGLCIAAHIDTDNGIRKSFRQLGHDGIYFCADGDQISLADQQKISLEFKDWLLTAGFDGIEVGSDKDRAHYRWKTGTDDLPISIPVILRNDCHCAEDLSNRQFYTYIKIAEACFSDLKQALNFPDTRIRFPVDVPAAPCPAILGLEIVAGQGKGFFDNLQIAFSDNLTCLIGPRGSGKSAIIESLRYMFGLNRIFDQLEPSLVSKAKSLQTATLIDSVVRVIYKRDDSQIHVLEATFDSRQDCVTKVYDLEGKAVEIGDIRTNGHYPLRLFGWSEIETLGREAFRQRDLLDRLIPDLDKEVDLRTQLRARVLVARRLVETSIDRLETILATNNGEIRKYREYKVEFDRLNTADIDQLFTEIDTAKAKQTLLEKVLSNVRSLLDELRTSQARSIFAGTDDLAKELSDTTQIWWHKGTLKPEITIKSQETAVHVGKAVATLEALEKDLEGQKSEFTNNINKLEEVVREKVGKEVTKQIAADLRRTASERLDRVNQLKREYADDWKKLQDGLQQWTAEVDGVTACQHKIGEMREAKKEEIEKTLNQFSTAGLTVSIQLDAGQDRAAFIEHLSQGGILSRESAGNYKATLLPGRIATFCTPMDLASSLLASDSGKLVGKVKRAATDMEIEVDKPTADKLVEASYPFAHEEDADVPSVNKVKLLRILGLGEVEWDDWESILLNGRPVDTLSPGQRSSAMLPLVALVENAPLVIDQPEDNLDNRLVGKVLVDVLANLKEKRQIIVATHNPNIVVSGDSEQVVVLDALGNNKGKCTHAASIDKQEIVTAVIEIMEGGKEAFRTRSKRYRIAS